MVCSDSLEEIMSEEPHVALCKDNSTVEYQGYASFSFLFTGLFQTCVVICGVAGNGLVLAVSSLNLNIFGGLRSYVIFLALCDMALLMSGWILFSLPSLIYCDDIPLFGAIISMYIVMFPLCNAILLACIWANVLCSVERYFAVCRPLWHRAMGKTKRIRVAFVVITILCIATNIPRFFEYKTGACFFNGEWYQSLEATSLTTDNDYKTIYVLGFHVAFVSLGPFLLLVVLNSAIWLAARKSEKATHFRGLSRRQKSTKRRRSTQQLTFMFLLVSAKYLVSYTLTAVLDGFEVEGNSSLLLPPLSYLVDISNVLVAFHSATNFFVYLACQRKFRLACQLLFCKRYSSDSPRTSLQSQIYSSIIQSTANAVLPVTAVRADRSSPFRQRSPSYWAHRNSVYARAITAKRQSLTVLRHVPGMKAKRMSDGAVCM